MKYTYTFILKFDYYIDKDKGIVKIEHTQEIPEYKKTSIIKSKEVRNNLKVFVILEAEYATMLLASEY